MVSGPCLRRSRTARTTEATTTYCGEWVVKVRPAVKVVVSEEVESENPQQERVSCFTFTYTPLY